MSDNEQGEAAGRAEPGLPLSQEEQEAKERQARHIRELEAGLLAAEAAAARAAGKAKVSSGGRSYFMPRAGSQSPVRDWNGARPKTREERARQRAAKLEAEARRARDSSPQTPGLDHVGAELDGDEALHMTTGGGGAGAGSKAEFSRRDEARCSTPKAGSPPKARFRDHSSRRDHSFRRDDTVRFEYEGERDREEGGGVSKCRIQSVSVPTYVEGGNWKCFLAEFEDMVELGRIDARSQLIYLKQSIPEEGRLLLYRQKARTVEDAMALLSAFYEPVKEGTVALTELCAIRRAPNERMVMLRGRIEEKMREWPGSRRLARVDREALVKEYFYAALDDYGIRDYLKLNREKLTMDQMVAIAQDLLDGHVREGSRKKVLRTTEPDHESKRVAELEKQLAEALSELNRERTRNRGVKPDILCWNCGKRGHYSRSCKSPKEGNGMKFRPNRSRPTRSNKEDRKPSNADSLNGSTQNQ